MPHWSSRARVPSSIPLPQLLLLLLLPLLWAPAARASPLVQHLSNDRLTAIRHAALLHPANRKANAASENRNGSHSIGTLVAIFAGVLVSFITTFAIAYFFYRKERRKLVHLRRAATPDAAGRPTAAALAPARAAGAIPPPASPHAPHVPHATSAPPPPPHPVGLAEGLRAGVPSHLGRPVSSYYLCGPASYGNLRNGSRLLLATVSANGSSVRLESPRLADLSATRELFGSLGPLPRRTRAAAIGGGAGGGGTGGTGGGYGFGVARPPRPGYPAAGYGPGAGVARQQRRRVRLVYRECASETGEVCMICLEPLDVDPVVAGECLHWTHEECLKGWLVKSVRKDCPACRRPLVCSMADEDDDGGSDGGGGGEGDGGR